MDRLRCQTFDDTEAHVNGLRQRQEQLETRLRLVEKALDTRATPLWRRIWFRVDGFRSWPYVERRRSRRWWHPPSQGRRVTDSQTA